MILKIINNPDVKRMKILVIKITVNEEII